MTEQKNKSLFWAVFHYIGRYTSYVGVTAFNIRLIKYIGNIKN